MESKEDARQKKKRQPKELAAPLNVPAKFVAHNEDRVRANAAQILKNYRAEVEP